MISLLIRLAGHCVEIKTEHKGYRTIFADYCLPEDTEETPEVTFEVTEESAKMEKALLLAEQAPLRPTYALEFLALYREISAFLLRHGTLIIHGSGISYNGQGILFSAPSGVGKSTHVSYWQELFPEQVIVINDDKPLIRTDGKSCLLCGTPWAGIRRLHRNAEIPLRVICCLERGEENRVLPITAGEALPLLLQAVNRPSERSDMDLVMGAVQRVLKDTAFFRVQCTNSPEAAETVQRALSDARLI